MSRALVPFTLAAALSACVADNGDEGILITKNVLPAAGCMFAANEQSPFLSSGQFSVFSPNAYQMHPQLKSRITAVAGQEDQRTIITRGARVDLTIVDKDLEAAMGGAAALQAGGITRFESLFTAPISPNGGVTDGTFDLITRQFLDELVRVRPAVLDQTTSFRTLVTASVVVYGTLAGAEVVSQPFQFPVTICNDCVVNVVGTCADLPDGPIREGNPCNVFQDGVVDCCTSGATNDTLVCPAVEITPPPV